MIESDDFGIRMDPDFDSWVSVAQFSRWLVRRARNQKSLRTMARLKSSIWVAAYLRRCQTEGVFGAVRRRGAEEAGAVFVKVALLDGNAMLYAPAPQTVYDDSRPIERIFAAHRRSRCRKPPSKSGWRKKSASIPMSGSSRPRTEQGGIFSIWRGPNPIPQRPNPPSPLRASDTAPAARPDGSERMRRGRDCVRRHIATGRYLARVTAMVEPRQAASMISADRSPNRSYRRDSRYTLCTEDPNSGLRNSNTRWKTALGMSSARAAQASGSPPGSLTTWAAMRAGNISASPSSSVKFSTSAANAAISRVSMARAARAAGIRAEALNGVSARLCRIKARSLALARKTFR